tara:strand:+ start:281 stop:1168 length:888 start_codon:yes stop_codon:yes gene_type:complete
MKDIYLYLILFIIFLFSGFYHKRELTKVDHSYNDSVQSRETNYLISYNIRYDNNWDIENSWLLRKNKICQLLNDYNPSIFGIQEGLLKQVSFIDDCLNNYVYVGVGRDDGRIEGEFCAIFFDTTRFRIGENSTFWLSETPDIVSIGWDASLERICTYGLFENKISREKFWVFNTHFDHLGIISRKKSSALILEKIKEINIQLFPIILMGDLNSIPNSDPINILNEELVDALQISFKNIEGPIGTFNDFDPNLRIKKRIDYFFTKDVDVLSYRHINDRLNNNKHISDHLPVMIEIF